MSRIAIGIVGYGKIAHDQHEPAIAAGADFELAAIVDPAATHPDVPAYRDVDAMLRDSPEIAAVALCMPPRWRGEAARAAIAAGRHVLLEKPPCATLAEAEAVARLAADRGATLYTAWHSRHGAAVEPARRWLAETRVRSVEVEWKEDVRVWHPGQAWIWQEGGFGVFDPGINALSILTAILTGPLRVVESDLQVPRHATTPVAARLALATADGAPIAAEFDFRQSGPPCWDIRVETDRGTLCLARGGNRLAVDGTEMPLAQEAEYPALYARFAELIRAGESDVDLAPLRLAEAAIAGGRVEPVAPLDG